MNREESIKLMALIKANFPNYHSKTDTQTLAAAAGLMELVLKEYDAEAVNLAFIKYISEPHEFAPNAGQLRALVQEILSPYGVTTDFKGNVICGESVQAVREFMIKRHNKQKRLNK
ncbi:MAG: replicative helicase loader/inhibitor [Oscillospiraceae bacterium]